MIRIVCVGNRYADVDCAGPRVFDRLASRQLPRGVELVDGGLAGLDLLPWVEGLERAVFVDNVVGFAPPGSIVRLDAGQAANGAGSSLDHGAGLAYALRMIPAACDPPPREMIVVGVEGAATDAILDEAAELCVALAAGTAESNSTVAGGCP